MLRKKRKKLTTRGTRSWGTFPSWSSEEISEPEKRTTELLADPETFKPKTSESEKYSVASQSTKEFSEAKEGGRAGAAVAVLKEVK